MEGQGPVLKVAVIAEFPAVRAGLRALVEADPAINVEWEYPALDAAHELPPADVLLLYAPAERRSNLGSVALSMPAVVVGALPAEVQDLLASGVRGLLSPDSGAEELSAALHAAAQGLHVLDGEHVRSLLHRTPEVSSAASLLTPRELEVLQLIALGLPNKLIADRLAISRHTAKFHVSAVLSKLGVSSRTEAVTVAAKRGLLVV